ncbi:hypothetical protein EQM14_06780 [Caproiciproducens sp. NJN-50]|uniref:hypothetical protein n=1 Tax=Acutalibacteraceae TaxID=3082771 RepID=UPI000FFE1454|nr:MULTISPECIES: hypothetical protein [Acutalibacteraceae]QAT49504.1 hypothetical protein EQM14_06780 [Caproiciproducens sp. NJN-50]
MFVKIELEKIKNHNEPLDRTNNCKIAISPATYSPDQIESYLLDDLFLQFTVADFYYFYINCNVDIAITLPMTSLKLKDQIGILSTIFKRILVNYDSVNNILSYQLEGISTGCKKAYENMIRKNKIDKLIKILFNKDAIQNEICQFGYYEYINSSDMFFPCKEINTIEQLFENEFFKTNGSLNLSSFTFQEIDNCGLVKYIKTKVNNVYLYIYGLEFNKKTYYVKYLHWY